MSTEIMEQPAGTAATEAKPGSLHPVVRRSRIFLAAWIAAEKELPPESRQLIEAHDKLHRAWRDAGWGDVPAELMAASKAVESDPLASIAFELRTKTNEEAHKEWRAQNPPRDQADRFVNTPND